MMRHAAKRPSLRPSPPRPQRGFTLMELLIVIGILAVLIGILLPVLGGVRNAARRATSEALVRDVVTASQTFMVDNRRAPGWFSQRALAASVNQQRGFTAMENALLELSGGVIGAVGDADTPTPSAMNSFLQVGPFNANNQNNVVIDTLGIGGQDGPGYLRLGENSFYPVRGQATNIDVYSGDNVEVVKGMPDVVDAFGTPLMMWVQDATSRAVNEVEDFARLTYSPGNEEANARFYYVTNHGYLHSGRPNDGPPTSSVPAQQGLGEREANQQFRSTLGSAHETMIRLQNMTAILGSPAFPSEADSSLPSASRGEVIVISAGRSRVYFERLSDSADDLPIGYGPNQYKPGTEEAARSALQDYDDIIQSTGG